MTAQKSETNSPVCIDVTSLMQPGIYEIFCLSTNRVYIGETQNILERLGKHSAMLFQNKHDCQPLQQDWNQSKYPIKNFRFKALYCGSSWQNQATRVEKEKQVIEEKLQASYDVYNKIKTILPATLYRQEISVNNVLYKSISSAVQQLDISETTLRRYLRDDTNTDYVYGAQYRHGYTQVIINNTRYKSYQEVVNAGLATDARQVGRRIRSVSPRWKDWVKHDIDE
jgi:AraC-like DNA-binding protein